MIKKRQKEVFEYVKSFTSEHGFSPTLEEIQDHFKFKSISTAHYHVDRLLDAGYLEKDAGRSRSLKVASVSFTNPASNKTPEYFSLPVLGSANCGPATIFAVEDPREYVSVSASTLGRKDKEGLFALEAEGDSMNQARVGNKREPIESGDYVIVDSNQNNPSQGDYILSVIDGCANIKKFGKHAGKLALVSESKSTRYKPIYLGSANDFMVNGKIIGVIKG